MLTSSIPKPAMSLIAALFVLAPLLVMPAAHGQTVPSATPAGKSTPARHALTAMFKGGLVYVKVSVNGAKKVWMMLDTGTATASIIDQDYAQRIAIKLTPEAAGAGGFGSETIPTFNTSPVHLSADSGKAGVVEFESFKLGGMMGPEGQPLAGLLGYSFLAGKTLVIDYKKSEVYFLTGATQTDSRDVKMELHLNIPTVSVTMAGHDVRALIDTGGAYGLLITPATAQDVGIGQYQDEATPINSEGHGGAQMAKVGKAPDINIGNLPVHDLTAVYTTFGTTGIEAGASLGKNFLKNYKVTINYGDNTVRFEP